MLGAQLGIRKLRPLRTPLGFLRAHSLEALEIPMTRMGIKAVYIDLRATSSSIKIYFGIPFYLISKSRSA